MTRETGAGLYAEWLYPQVVVGGATYPAGTLILNMDYRTFTPIDDTEKMVDKSAGADTDATYLPTLADGKMAATILHDGGTLLFGALSRGLQGTLVYGPSGTADGKAKITRPATISAAKLTQGYDQISIWDVTWQPSAVRVYGTWLSGA